MKKRNIVISLLTIIFILTCFIIQTKSLPKKILVESDGDKFSVGMYELPAILRIDPLYQPSEQQEELLMKYSWLGALLFTLNGFDQHIPEEQWPDFADGEWPKERFDALNSYYERIATSILDDQDYWSGKYYKIENITKCKTGNSEYLSFCLELMNNDGTFTGSKQYERLKYVDGRWKRTLESIGQKRAKQIAYCYDQAVSATQEGQLRVLPAAKLK